jgi:hypothetical protein
MTQKVNHYGKKKGFSFSSMFLRSNSSPRASMMSVVVLLAMMSVVSATQFDETDGVVCGVVKLPSSCKARTFAATFNMPKTSSSVAALQMKFEAPLGWKGGIALWCGGIAGTLDQCSAHKGDDFISCPPGGLSVNDQSEATKTFFAKLTPPSAEDCSGEVRLTFEPILGGGNGTCVTPLAEIDACKDNSPTDAPWPPSPNDHHNGPTDHGSDDGFADGPIDFHHLWAIPNGLGFVLVMAIGGCLLLICLPAVIVVCCCVAAASRKKKAGAYARLPTESVGDVPQVFTAKN